MVVTILSIVDPPEILVVLAGLLTQFGDLWFVIALLTGLYWSGYGTQSEISTHRRTIASIFGLALTTFLVVLLLKVFFGASRPPGAGATPGLVPAALEPAWVAATGVDSPSFPSGHAALTTASYVALALHLDRFPDVRRWIGAVAVVGVVSWTRVALGVHYPIDVVAGAALGLGLVVLYEVLLSNRPFATYGGAILVGVAAILVDPGADALWVLGVTLGAAVGWTIAEDAASPVSSPAAVATLGLVAIVGGVGYVGVDGGWLALGLGGGVGALLIGLPGLCERDL